MELYKPFFQPTLMGTPLPKKRLPKFQNKTPHILVYHNKSKALPPLDPS